MSKVWRRMWAKSLLISLCVLLLMVSSGYCGAETDGMKDWVVPMFGVFKVPPEFHAADFKELKALAEQQKGKIPADTVKALGKVSPFDKLEIAGFQLTMNDGQVYRQGWLIAIKDRLPTKQINEFSSFLTNPEDRVKAIMMHDSLSRDVGKLSYKDPKTGVAFKVLELPPLEFISIAGTPAAGGSARVMVEYGEFLIPFYAQGYVFVADGHLSGMMLITTDGDSPFWRGVMSPIVQSLELRNK